MCFSFGNPDTTVACQSPMKRKKLLEENRLCAIPGVLLAPSAESSFRRTGERGEGGGGGGGGKASLLVQYQGSNSSKRFDMF